MPSTCDQFEKDLLTNRILKPGDLYNELTYSQLLREWLIWLHSSAPIYQGYEGEICFLHGNVSYVYDEKTGMRTQSTPVQNRAKETSDPDLFRGDVVFPNTPIFIPVLSSFYSVGENYYGTNLDTIAQCQFVCRRDINETKGLWCRIYKKEDQKKDCPEIKLEKYIAKAESPSFELKVSEDSPLRKHFEIPIESGTYYTACVAYVLLIKGLGDEGEYRLRFGGYGRGAYKSDSVFDFRVLVKSQISTMGRLPSIMKQPPAVQGLASL